MRERESNGNTPGTTYPLPLSSISEHWKLDVIKFHCSYKSNISSSYRNFVWWKSKIDYEVKFFSLSKGVRFCHLVIEFADKMTQNCLLIQLNILFYAIFLQSKGMCNYIVQCCHSPSYYWIKENKHIFSITLFYLAKNIPIRDNSTTFELTTKKCILIWTFICTLLSRCERHI